MRQKIIDKRRDPMGWAIYDYYYKGKAAKLKVISEDFEDDYIPVSELFRGFEQMTQIEKEALRLAEGAILDVGAGSGCHSLALKEMGKDSLAIDISPLAVEVMEDRGLNVRMVDFYDDSIVATFDTILMLMNGTGIIGGVDNMERFFSRLSKLLNPSGILYIDSSDLRYLYEDENGSFFLNIADKYYGEMEYKMKYKNIEGDWFDWLYIDIGTFSYYATKYGYNVELVVEGEHYDYLAKVTRAGE